MELILNNNIIPLPASASMSLVHKSPLIITSDGEIPGSYIFNFSLPATEILRKVFGQAHRVQKGGAMVYEVPFIISQSSLRYEGTCIISQASTDSYELIFTVENGDFTSQLQNKNIRDLDFGGDISITDIFSTAHSDYFSFPSFAFVSANESRFEAFGFIDIDITNALNTSSEPGTKFTAASDMQVSHTINCNATIISGSLELRVYKNDVLIDTNVISASGNFTKTYIHDLEAGDEIKVWMWVCSTTSSPYIAEMYVNLLSHSFFDANNAFDDCITKTQDDSDFVVFPVLNKNFFDSFPDDAFLIDNTSIKVLYTEHFPVLNYFIDGHFPMMLSGIKNGEAFYAANLFTPFIYMRAILNKICEDAGYLIENNPFDTDDFANMVFLNTYAENTYAGSLASLLKVKSTFNLNDHLPDISQIEFIKSVSILTGFMPVVSNNTRIIKFVDIKRKNIITSTNLPVAFPGILIGNPTQLIKPEYKGIKFELTQTNTDKYLENIKEASSKLSYKGEVEHLNDLPSSGNEINDMYLVTALNEFYVFQYNPETYTLTWWFFSKNFKLMYTEGEDPFLSITTKLCPVLTERRQDDNLGAPENRFWTIPRNDQPGIMEGFPDSLGAAYGLQVLFYAGSSTDSLGNAYPLGTSRKGDATGTPLFTDLSADELFDARYKEFIQWLAYSAKLVTARSILTATQLQNIKFDTIYTYNAFHFLIKEIRVNIESNGLSVAEIDFYVV